MKQKTAQPDRLSGAPGPTPDVSEAATARSAPPAVNPKPVPVAKGIRGQKYFAPEGRHSQQSHRRAQERAEAEGHATPQQQHAHDRGNVKAEVSRLAALKLPQKPNPPK